MEQKILTYDEWNVLFDGIPRIEFISNDVDEALDMIVGFVLIGTIDVSEANFESEKILMFSLILIAVRASCSNEPWNNFDMFNQPSHVQSNFVNFSILYFDEQHMIQ